MSEREISAIDCWIEGCPWWQNEPPNAKVSQTERDDVRIAHMWSVHTVRELTKETDRRILELATETLTREQREDRVSIIRVLRATVYGVEQHPLPDDPV